MMVRSSNSRGGSRSASSTDVKIPVIENGMNQSISKPYNKYGWFLDSDEAEYEEEPLPSVKVSRREAKWLEMTRDDKRWNTYVTKKFETVKWRCRKGIPHSVRGRAWFYLCGGHKCLKRDPEGFERLSNMNGDAHVLDEITKDLHRQFPHHFMFAESDMRSSPTRLTPNGNGYDHAHRSGDELSGRDVPSRPNGQESLYRLLKAYSILKPKVGYCQGQAPIACTLLMVMPPEHAFWSFLSINDLYLVGYFDHGLESIQLHGDMLMAFIKKCYPSVYRLLRKQGIEPVLFMTEWFMCLYTRTLPWPLVLRIWDMFMCEGIIVAFKVAIVLVGTVIQGERKSCTDLYSTLTLLKNIPEKYLVRVKQIKRDGILHSKTSSNERKGPSVHYQYPLIEKVIKLDLTEHDLKREHAIQANERRVKRKQTEEAKRIGAQSKVDATDNHQGMTPNGGGALNGGAPSSGGTLNSGNKYGTMNGRSPSSLSRGSHRHRRAPFIEFEFSLGGKVLTNKPEYKPNPIVSNGSIGNGLVADGNVSTDHSAPLKSHTFLDGPSGRTVSNGHAPSPRTPSPRIERGILRKSSSRSPSKSDRNVSKSDRSSSIERNRRSGSSRRSHSREREPVTPRKEKIPVREKGEGSPLRSRRHGHQDRSDSGYHGHRDRSHRGHQEDEHRDQQDRDGNESGQLTIGQYKRSSSRNADASRSDADRYVTSSHYDGADHNHATSPSVQHTHLVRDTKEGVPKDVAVDGNHDHTSRSPTKPTREVVIPIQFEPGAEERSRSRSSHVSGYLPMSVLSTSAIDNGCASATSRQVENGRSSAAGHSFTTSRDAAAGRISAVGRESKAGRELVAGKTPSAGGESSADGGRYPAVRTSTPISPVEERSRSAHYTVIDHSKTEVKETVIYPVVKSREIPIQVEGRTSGLRSESGLHTRSEERSVREDREKIRYEGTGKAFGAASGDTIIQPFRPFSRSVSGANNYSSTLTNSRSVGGTTGYASTKTTPNGGSRHAMVH